MKRSGSSSDRDRRLGIKARGSMDFLLLCMKRGVPPEKISTFLLGLGLDAQTVNRWMDHLKREMAGIPERTPMGSERPQPVGRPAGTAPVTLEGKTATDFVLPDLDATKTGHGQCVENSVIAVEEEIDVSLEISEKELRKANQEDSQGYDRRRVTADAPPSLLVSTPPECIASIPDAPRVQLEKQSQKKKRRSSKREDERKLLATPQARLAAFAAVILLTWLLSDAGWFPGGSSRQATMPSNDLVAREEPVRAKPEPPQAPPQAEAPLTPVTGPTETAQEAPIRDYPDPWATPAVPSDQGRVPGSSKPSVRRSKSAKKSRTSIQNR